MMLVHGRLGFGPIGNPVKTMGIAVASIELFVHVDDYELLSLPPCNPLQDRI